MSVWFPRSTFRIKFGQSLVTVCPNTFKLLDGITVYGALLLDELPKLSVLAGEHISLRNGILESKRDVAICAGKSTLYSKLRDRCLLAGGARHGARG